MSKDPVVRISEGWCPKLRDPEVKHRFPCLWCNLIALERRVAELERMIRALMEQKGAVSEWGKEMERRLEVVEVELDTEDS